MTDLTQLRPATADEIATALSFALQYDGRRRVHDAANVMAQITAERLVQHLQQSGFVIARRRQRHATHDGAAYAALGRVTTLDQVIDRATAQELQADVCRDHAVAGWVVMRDQPPTWRVHPFIARLVTDAPTSYVLTADTLAGIHDQLPPGLVRSDHQPADPPDLIEVWFAV